MLVLAQVSPLLSTPLQSPSSFALGKGGKVKRKSMSRYTGKNLT